MHKNWIVLLTLGIPLNWMGFSASFYSLGKPEISNAKPILMPVSLSKSMPVRSGPTLQKPTKILAQSSQPPINNPSAQGFGDVSLVGDWKTDDDGHSEVHTEKRNYITVILQPGPVQIELTSIPKNYKIWATLVMYDRLYNPKQVDKCRMYLNPHSASPPCVIDQTRPVEVFLHSRWVEGPKPSRVYSEDRVVGIYHSPQYLYYMNGKPVYVTVKNAKKAKFEFPAPSKPKPKEEDTRRCWRGITGVVSCW
jgi:hypothetical protein